MLSLYEKSLCSLDTPFLFAVISDSIQCWEIIHILIFDTCQSSPNFKQAIQERCDVTRGQGHAAPSPRGVVSHPVFPFPHHILANKMLQYSCQQDKKISVRLRLGIVRCPVLQLRIGVEEFAVDNGRFSFAGSSALTSGQGSARRGSRRPDTWTCTA